MSGAGAEKRECRPRRTARCRRGCMPGVCASLPGSRTQNGGMHQDPHGKDKKRTQKNKRHSLVRPQAPATTGGGSAVVRGLSCASCTPAKIIGQIPMCRSLPDGKLTKSAPHRFPDGNFYSAAPGMISDTARKKHSARPPISPQPAGGDEKRPITLRGNFLTEPLSGQ